MENEGEEMRDEANEGQTISQVCELSQYPMPGTFSPPATINNPPRASFFEISHLLASLIAQASISPRNYTEFQVKSLLRLKPRQNPS